MQELRARKKKIMVVDDDKEFLEELRILLEESGYELVTVDDAAQAEEIARQTIPQLALVDLKMPKKSGFQVADELKHLTELSGIPIIAMSAHYQEDYRGLLDLCGIDHYLSKPFQPLEVIREIEAALAKRQ